VQSIDSAILNRIYGLGRGAVIVPSHFLDLGSREAVDLALHRLAKKGTLRRLARGLYDYPKVDPRLGLLAPTVDAIANAIKGRDATRIQASGAYAANLLGLSDQVPLRVVFLTDGKSRRVQLGKQQVIFKRTTPRNMATAGKVSGLVIQALRYLGRRHVDQAVVTKLRRRLKQEDKKQLLGSLRYAPAWVAEIMRKVATAD
jgi:hypothetical protein